MRSISEEDYLKAIHSLHVDSKPITTNELAEHLQMKPSSITDMIKKLSEKGWVHYVKYKGVSLSDAGRKIAISIVRKHRLWETFLVKQLNFGWDQVHEIAEQLEHIQSDELIDRLDEFLDHPKYDPHGDPIPDKNGKLNDSRKSCLLTEVKKDNQAIIIGVNDASSSLLQFLSSEGLILGTSMKVLEVYDFDNSIKVSFYKNERILSEKVAKNIIVQIQ